MLKQAAIYVKVSPLALHLGLVILQIVLLGGWYVKDVVNLDPYPIHTQGTEFVDRPDPEIAAIAFMAMIQFVFVPALLIATILTFIYVYRVKSKTSLSSLPVIGFHLLSYGFIFFVLWIIYFTISK